MGFCTMGFHVTDSLSQKYFLTASHCTGSYGGVGGITFFQNTSVSGNQVGSEIVNPAWNTTGCLPTVTYCRLADVALVQFDSSQFFSKRVAQGSSVGTGSSAGALTLGTWYTVGTQGDAASGTTVYKTGRSTGSTSGSIVGTCVDAGSYSAAGPVYLEVFCASEVAARSDDGDSGGPVYHFRFPLASTSRQADGILYAGGIVGGSYHYWYSSWTQVEATLGRSLYAY